MGLGAGALIIIGGTVAIVGFLTVTTGALVAVQGYTDFSEIGVEALTGFASAFFNVRLIAPGTTAVALSATIGAGATAQLGAMRINEEIDALIGGFRPLFRALDPDQVNALSGQLIQALQGQGGTINSFLAQTAALTSTLGDRDQLIGETIISLNTVLGSIGDQSDQFAKAVDALAELVKGLADRKQDISNGLASTNAAAASITDVLVQARPPFAKTIHETDRASAIVVADHDYFDNLLNTLPDAYQALARQGIYGDFFSFYLCDVVLKLNGKGGQPVYVKIAGQSTGRCAPR
jgi:phospholipid/cholesterol/gamma-HCH transport system substrate-binding protein